MLHHFVLQARARMLGIEQFISKHLCFIVKQINDVLAAGILQKIKSILFFSLYKLCIFLGQSQFPFSVDHSNNQLAH